ncbi:hypothetical protein PQX77_001165 [Marasmius sp. AFHP31]|nr:hypothetical protein PQX77_001165 [Marasmius sp. AFHP31]
MASEQEFAKQAVEAYTSVKMVIVQPILTFSSVLLVYGMYIIIFGLSVNVLWRRRDSPGSKAYTRWIIALFALTTIFNATTVWLYMKHALVAFNAIKTENYIPLFETASGTRSRPELTAQLYVFLLHFYIWDAKAEAVPLDKVFECIFWRHNRVYRCYVIWGYSKWILCPFTIVVPVTDMIGLVATAVAIAAQYRLDAALYERSNGILKVLVIITTVYTLLLTLLTAGRIWWMARQVGQIRGDGIFSKYKIFVATILESGLLYSAILVITIVLQFVTDPRGEGMVPFDLNVLSVQMAAIAPTLIIIRIAYGQAVESVQRTLSTLQFTDGGNNFQRRSTVARGTVDLRRSLGEVEERATVGKFEMEKVPSQVAGNLAV